MRLRTDFSGGSNSLRSRFFICCFVGSSARRFVSGLLAAFALPRLLGGPWSSLWRGSSGGPWSSCWRWFRMRLAVLSPLLSPLLFCWLFLPPSLARCRVWSAWRCASPRAVRGGMFPPCWLSALACPLVTLCYINYKCVTQKMHSPSPSANKHNNTNG